MNRVSCVLSHLQNGPGNIAPRLCTEQQRRNKTKRAGAGAGTKAVIFDMGGVLLPSPGFLFSGEMLLEETHWKHTWRFLPVPWKSLNFMNEWQCIFPQQWATKTSVFPPSH